MPLLLLKRNKKCTYCHVPLPTKVYTHSIRFNRVSALASEPTVVELLLCPSCHACLTDRLFDSVMLSDSIDIAQRYG